MSYRIKFLEAVTVNQSTGEAHNVYIKPSYSDSEIDKIAENWKAIGLKRIEDIEVGTGSKYSAREIIDMFYPDNSISGDDVVIKNDLLRRLGGKGAQENDDTASNSGDGEVEKKELRAELFDKAKRMFETGIIDKMPARNLSTERLENIVK